LEWCDYVAMTMTFFETTLLPILVLIIVLIFIELVLRL